MVYTIFIAFVMTVYHRFWTIYFTGPIEEFEITKLRENWAQVSNIRGFPKLCNLIRLFELILK